MVKNTTLLFILLIGIVILLVICGKNGNLFTTGGSENTRRNKTGGSSIDVAEQTYNRILPTINSVGTSKHIVKYLSEILDIKSLDVSDYVTHKHLIEHKELLELLIIATDRTTSQTPEELIVLTDLRYQWFLPADKGKVLYDKKKFTTDQKPVIRVIIDDYSKQSTRNLLTHEKESLVTKLTPLSNNYRKFQNLQSGKKLASLKKEPVVLDSVAFSGIVKLIIDKITLPTTAPMLLPKPSNLTSMNIREKLDNIDLIALYPREPYLVKAFIARIKKEIRIIESHTEGWQSITPFGRDTARVTLHDIARKNILEQQTEQLRHEKNKLQAQIARDRVYRDAAASPLDLSVPYRVRDSLNMQNNTTVNTKPVLKSNKF